MTDIVDPVLEAYAEAHTTPPPPHLAVAVGTQATSARPLARMMVGALEGRFLEMLVFAQRPRRVLEIGTFSGYSSIWPWRPGSPPAGGSPAASSARATPRWPAPHRHQPLRGPDRGDRRAGPRDASPRLDGPFDFVFIDADKAGYLAYYEAVLPKLAAGGLIAADNTLWSGNVVDAKDSSDNTEAIRTFNDAVAADRRVVCVQLTVRDGVTLIRRADDVGAARAVG